MSFIANNVPQPNDFLTRTAGPNTLPFTRSELDAEITYLANHLAALPNTPYVVADIRAIGTIEGIGNLALQSPTITWSIVDGVGRSARPEYAACLQNKLDRLRQFVAGGLAGA